jgi:hypothetical protein
MEAEYSSETFIPICQITRRHTSKISDILLCYMFFNEEAVLRIYKLGILSHFMSTPMTGILGERLGQLPQGLKNR